MNYSTQNIFDEERRNNFYELYISNVDKRLRELDQPKDVDCKRWVWELIQNAKDSIVGQNDRKKVDIEIIVEGDKYTFKHNGSPFVKKTLYGLLYKYSKGKKENSESTGRFGTGFLTTHTLSKVVNISGDIVLGDKTKGFTITMYREGEGNELLEGLNKTEDSFQLYDQSFNWTTYEYLAKTERNKEAGRLGIQNFKENITKVMLFCPEIHNVKLNDNGKILTITQGEFTKLQGGCEKLILNVNDDGNYFSRTFIYEKYEENHEKLNERFNDHRNLQICCAIELDNENNIFVDEFSPCLFCSLPFVGSEKHKLPFIINSQNFEPDSERQSILLDGIEINEKNGKITDQGINKLILSRSQHIYEHLLDYLCKESIGKRYLLARGLTYVPENDEIQSFDHQWYENKFVMPMRDILMKYPIAWNGEEYIKLENIPLVNCYGDSDLQQEAYNFMAKVYEQKIPTYEESVQFEKYIWRNDSRIKYITLKKCTQDLSNFNNMKTLIQKISNAWEWVDSFLVFIKNNEPECLKLYSVIPNMNLEFVQLTDNLYTSKEVPDNMIDYLEKIGNQWKSTHLHKNIRKYTPGIDHNIQYAMSVIKNKLNTWTDNILILISYIPYNHEDKKFVQKRNTIYDLCKDVFKNTIPDKMDGNSFPKELWNGIDEMVFEKLIEMTENNQKLDDIYTIEHMKCFLECISEYYPTFRENKIVPNQNGIFCLLDSLYEDIDIPDFFKDCMKYCFNYDIRSELLDKKLINLKSLTIGRNKNIYDYNDLLKTLFQSNKIDIINKRKASRYLIRIIPKKVEVDYEDNNNIQRNIFNIYKLFTKCHDNNECYEIENDINNKGFWYHTNLYIYKEIMDIIEKYNNIDELSQYLNLSHQEVFDYLNIIIHISNKGRIIPNQYNEFCYLKDLFNEGIPNIETKEIELISEELKDIARDLGYDVRKYLIHQKMERICVSNVSEKEINEKIAKLMEENNNNPMKRIDENFNSAANNLIEYNFMKIRNNSLNDEIMYIFGKVYIANIRNRLRELDHPSIIDCKRWVWELIQNAKDSIVGHKERKDIDIEIIVEGEKYIFKHNGSPFTNKTLPALLYKFSENKSDNSQSIGRFGTGFLTTHSLSKTVHISGDIISNNEIKRFNVTMYREGEEEELLEGLNKTKNSYEEEPTESEGWTIFEYEAKTERNKEAGQLGIQNFKENITKVMLFCPEIRSIKLDDNGKILTITQGDKFNNLYGGCEKLILNVNDDDNHYSRTLLYKKYEENNEKLNERFNDHRNLKICCAVELDKDNNIFVNESSPSLFCSLPLVGSEKHQLPFIINSQNFEPDSERQSILLEGREMNEINGKISNPGINKMILSKSQPLFDTLIDCLCKENVGKRYLLARGLSNIPRNDEIRSFDRRWYKNLFVLPMRNILMKYPIVWNGEKYIEIKNIPMIKSYENSNIQQEAYNFIYKFYDKNIPTYEESIQFENYIWKNDDRIKYITMRKCTQDLSNFKNMTNFIQKMNNAWEWIDDFLVFIKNNEPECLKLYNVIPNMNLEFVQLTDNLYTSKEVPENMIDCLEKIGYKWKSTHLHKNIIKYTPGTDHNIQYAMSVIKNKLNTWTNDILILIAYIPYDHEDKKFVQKRNTIYDLCKDVFKNTMPDKMDGSSFPKELWNGIDEMVFEKLIEFIENSKKLGGIFTIEYMKKFLECVLEYYPIFRNRYVVPNQNGLFCLVNHLYEDIEIYDFFKDCMKYCFNYDIRSELIDKQLTDLKSLTIDRKKNIYDYNYLLKKFFQSIRIGVNNKRKASRYLIRIIPKKVEVENEDNNSIQRSIFNIYKLFTKCHDNNECYEIENDINNKGFWYHTNLYIYKEIMDIIEKYNNIDELSQYLNLSHQEVFDYLNIIINISNKGRIIPNQYNEFCYLKDLFNEGIPNIETKEIELISEELKDIARDLGYDVRKYLIHQKMERICVSNVSEKEINEKIAKLMEENNNNPMKRIDENFNSAANNLIEYNFLRLRNNSLNDEIMYIFGKVYIANIRNRLRELDHPSIIDCKRWVWELIQNAKDSIVGHKERKDIDIEIIVEGEKYIFKHNGSPFTNKTLPALLYKFSEGKSNSLESIGRFGTGFLTTHCLSKTVHISGDIISKDKIKRFNVTMYREGEEEELLEGLNKTKNSYEEELTESEGWTIFEYETKTVKNKEAGQLGIQNFKENITKVMLFCPEIRSIKLDDNGKILTIDRSECVRNLYGGCEKLTLNINNNNIEFSRKFLYLKKEEKNGNLTARFKVDRNLRICCAIELDKNNNIFVDESSPSLFCSLPLVGSEKHKLPFIINSRDFELNTERQGILLEGNEVNEKDGIISYPGINKMILLESLSMFNTLINCLCKENVGRRYLLARGLSYVPRNDEIPNFDQQWYIEKFVMPMRDILMKFSLVWNGKKYIEIKNLPMINCYNRTPIIQRKAYDFIAKLYDQQVPTYEEAIQFENYIWKNDNRIQYITMKKYTQYLSNFNNMTNLIQKIDNAWEWLDDFLIFIKNYEPECLRLYSVIPNMNLQFVQLSSNIFTSKDVPDNMIECLEKIGYQWKSNHLHKNIKKYTPGTDHNIQYTMSVIKNKLNTWTKDVLILIAYIPNDHEDRKFVQKRNTIYDLCKDVFKNSIPDKMDGNNFPREFWSGIDEMVFERLIELIEKNKRLGGIFTIEYMKKFLECVSEYYPAFRRYKIVPNQNGIFCLSDSLCEDIEIPDLFKDCMKNCFNADIRGELIDKQLLSIRALTNGRHKRIHNYNNLLMNSFQSIDIHQNYKQAASKYLIRIIPKNQNDWQRCFFDAYKFFKNINDNNYFEIERNEYNSKIWNYSNKYIFQEIIAIISKYNDVDTLARNFGIQDSEKIFVHLNTITKFSSEGRIIPNQYKVFCYAKDLSMESLIRNEKIPDELKDIAKELGYDVKAKLIHPRMDRSNRIFNRIYTNKDICSKIDKLMKKNYADPKNHSNPKFKDVVNRLVELYFDKIGDQEFKSLFPITFSERENIILKVLYNKETRKNMTELGKKYGEECIPKLLQNETVVKMIMEGKLNENSRILKFIEIYEEFDEIIDKILNNPEILDKLDDGDGKKYTPKKEEVPVRPSKYEEIEKKYGEECIPKLLNNEDIVKMIIEGKLEDQSNIKTFIEQYDQFDDIIEKLLTNPAMINKIENDEISDDHYNRENKELMAKLSKYTEVDERFGEECIPKLLQNESIVDMIMKERLKDNSPLKQFLDQYKDEGEDEVINKLLNNPKTMERLKNGEISDEKYEKEEKDYSIPVIINSINNKSVRLAFNSSVSDEEKEFYEKSMANVMKYNEDFDFTNANQFNGFFGEAYIYEKLLKSKKFKSITWTRRKEDGERFEYNGKTYFIDPNCSDYNIIAETQDDHKYYIIVKSTRYDFDNKVPLYFNKKQIDKMKKIRSPNQYILAVVFGVMNNPKYFFMNLKSNILIKENFENETYKILVNLEKQYGSERISQLLQNIEIFLT